MRSAECGERSAECGERSAVSAVRRAECSVRRAARGLCLRVPEVPVFGGMRLIAKHPVGQAEPLIALDLAATPQAEAIARMTRD